MTRKEITRDLAARYNQREGSALELSKEYGNNYNVDKFNRDIKKYGIVRDKETNLYIIPDETMKGQIDILGGTGEPQSLEGTKLTNTMTDTVTKQQGGNTMPESTPDKELEEIKVNNEPTKSRGLKAEGEVKVNDPMPRKKKTFEIDTDLEQLIRVQAAILDITINDYVNEVLRKSISDNVKSIIK